MSCKRYAITVWFSGTSRPSYICYDQQRGYVSCSQRPQLEHCFADKSEADAAVRLVGNPWGASLREAPKVVDVDIAPMLLSRKQRLLDEIAEIDRELQNG